MIQRFFTSTFNVKRNDWLTDDQGNRYSDLIDKGSFAGHKQQASAEMVQNFGLNFQTAYMIWCPIDTDVLPGDVLIQGRKKYTVKGVKVNDYGNNSHLMLAVEGGDSVSPTQVMETRNTELEGIGGTITNSDRNLQIEGMGAVSGGGGGGSE